MNSRNNTQHSWLSVGLGLCNICQGRATRSKFCCTRHFVEKLGPRSPSLAGRVMHSKRNSIAEMKPGSNITAVLRVKRKRTEDPVDAFMFQLNAPWQQVKRRETQYEETSQNQGMPNSFSFFTFSMAQLTVNRLFSKKRNSRINRASEGSPRESRD